MTKEVGAKEEDGHETKKVVALVDTHLTRKTKTKEEEEEEEGWPR